MLNSCNFIGRLGKQPDIRYTANGDPVASFSLACGEKWKDKQGNPQERTEWVNCSAFGKLAEIIGKYLDKGSLIHVSGKMQTDKYTDKQTGQDRYSTKIIVRDMKILGSKNDNGAQNSNQAPQQNQAPTGQQQAPSGQFDNDFDDDLPF